jgi:hypothetical protein
MCARRWGMEGVEEDNVRRCHQYGFQLIGRIAGSKFLQFLYRESVALEVGLAVALLFARLGRVEAVLRWAGMSPAFATTEVAVQPIAKKVLVESLVHQAQ